MELQAAQWEVPDFLQWRPHLISQIRSKGKITIIVMTSIEQQVLHYWILQQAIDCLKYQWSEDRWATDWWDHHLHKLLTKLQDSGSWLLEFLLQALCRFSNTYRMVITLYYRITYNRSNSRLQRWSVEIERASGPKEPRSPQLSWPMSTRYWFPPVIQDSGCITSRTLSR